MDLCPFTEWHLMLVSVYAATSTALVWYLFGCCPARILGFWFLSYITLNNVHNLDPGK